MTDFTVEDVIGGGLPTLRDRALAALAGDIEEKRLEREQEYDDLEAAALQFCRDVLQVSEGDIALLDLNRKMHTTERPGVFWEVEGYSFRAFNKRTMVLKMKEGPDIYDLVPCIEVKKRSTNVWITTKTLIDVGRAIK